MNISTDGWSDNTMRCFNGYIAQGIDDEWNMQSIPFAFRPVHGSHTGVNIRKQYNDVTTEFEIKEKVFKIVADSAANNKCAFRDIFEASDETLVLARMVNKRRKTELYFEKLNYERKKEEEKVITINDSINAFNTVKKDEVFVKSKTAVDVLLMLDNDEDDETEEISEANDDYDDDIADQSGRYEDDDDLDEDEEGERIKEKEAKRQEEEDTYAEKLVYN